MIGFTFRQLPGLPIAALLIGAGTASHADDAPKAKDYAAAGISRPAEPVPAAAFDVLWSNCSRCHQKQLLINLAQPAGGIGYIIELDKLAADGTLVTPGDPVNSDLYTQVFTKNMPYDVGPGRIYSGPMLSDTDKQAIATWISSLKPRSVVSAAAASSSCQRTFITNDQIVSAIFNDFSNQIPTRQKGMRYITLTNLYNACVADDALKVYRQAVVKLLNSLSTSSTLVPLATIDPAQTIIPFNLNDVGWSEAIWNTLLSQYPYATHPNNSAIFSTLASNTDTVLPYIRGDWFANNASKEQLYTLILGLQDTFAKQTAGIVNVTGDINSTETAGAKTAQRAGLSGIPVSGVSLNNRIIERHPFINRSGYFWTTYDFNSSSDDKAKLHDIFQHPFGPVGTTLPTNATAFTQNGGETIFSLPNGFQGYFVNGADGGRLDKAAVNIVIDPTRRDFAVTNGISCMGCHDAGINRATDEVKQAVIATGPLQDTLTFLAGLYPDPGVFNQLLANDRSAFTNALKSAGLDPTLKYSDPTLAVNHGQPTEMINALSLLQDVNLTLAGAASELGLEPDEFGKDSSRAGGIANQLYVSLANSNVVPRDRFEGAFTQIVKSMNTDTVIDVSKLTPVLPLPSLNLPPLNAFVLRQTDAHSLQKISEVTEQRASFHVTLASDRMEYDPNAPATIYINSTQGCYLTLLSVDGLNKATILVPSANQPENYVSPERPMHFPSPGNNATFAVSDSSGKSERIIAICDPVSSRSTLLSKGVRENGLLTIKDFDLMMVGSNTESDVNRPPVAVAGIVLKIK